MNRLPFEDLHREVGHEHFGLLADRIGRTRRTLHRWQNDGVPIAAADEAAIRIGSHPAAIWPDHWNQAR